MLRSATGGISHVNDVFKVTETSVTSSAFKSKRAAYTVYHSKEL